MTDKKNLTRRDFVADAGKLAIGAAIMPKGFPTIVPRHVLGGPGYTAPSAMLNIGVVGVGGQGSGNARSMASENLVAFCDVDPAFMQKNVMGGDRPNTPPSPETVAFRDKYQKATKYTDFREMLAKHRDLDAVIIATPDHLHATVAAAAMRAGKHVYCQKPLTYSVYEARLLSRLAREHKVVTQMGNQGHSGEGTRRVVEWVRAGVIGPVREVHIYTDRPARFWAQGLPRPAASPAPAALSAGNVRAVSNALSAALANANPTMPEGLRWDLYLGPVAEDIPYHPVYHPFTWRGWTDFGVGALGDMGAHLIDQAYWSLELTQPTSIEATSSLWGTLTVPPPAGSPAGTRPTSKPVSYPMASTVHYQFPAVGARPAVKMSWYDGGLFPPRPDGLPDDVVFDSEGGGILIGDKGILIHNTYGNNPRLFPMSVAEAGAAVAQTIPRIAESHEMNWVNACKGQGKASSPFEYGAALNETMLLGVAALRAGQGRKVMYDAANMQFTNAPDANQYLTREYRAGWAL
ncbi:MAG: putative oxidoreductase [Gemmatimonadetes bacterium]|nr:putative oxidoreductase [Gemmatimonadota bacterium]